MMKLCFLFAGLLIVNFIIGQQHKLTASVHVTLSVPTYSEIPSMGAGLGATNEIAINKKLATLFSVDFHSFYGNLISSYNEDTIKGFSILPIMVGFKYYSKEKFYIGGQGGIIKGLKNTGNCPGFAINTGMLAPLKTGNRIDIGLRFTGILRRAAIQENNFLKAGGYSFISGVIGFCF